MWHIIITWIATNLITVLSVFSAALIAFIAMLICAIINNEAEIDILKDDIDRACHDLNECQNSNIELQTKLTDEVLAHRATKKHLADEIMWHETEMKSKPSRDRIGRFAKKEKK